MVSAGFLTAQDKPAPKTWDKEPANFARIPIGASLDDAKKLNQFDSCNSFGDAGTDCEIVMPAGSFKLLVKFKYAANGRFKYASAYYPEEHFDEMVRVAVGLYGMPSHVERSKVVGGNGGTYGQMTLVWTGKRVSIVMDRFDDKVTTGALTVSLLADDEEARQKAESDLRNTLK